MHRKDRALAVGVSILCTIWSRSDRGRLENVLQNVLGKASSAEPCPEAAMDVSTPHPQVALSVFREIGKCRYRTVPNSCSVSA